MPPETIQCPPSYLFLHPGLPQLDLLPATTFVSQNRKEGPFVSFTQVNSSNLWLLSRDFPVWLWTYPRFFLMLHSHLGLWNRFTLHCHFNKSAFLRTAALDRFTRSCFLLWCSEQQRWNAAVTQQASVIFKESSADGLSTNSDDKSCSSPHLNSFFRGYFGSWRWMPGLLPIPVGVGYEPLIKPFSCWIKVPSNINLISQHYIHICCTLGSGGWADCKVCEFCCSPHTPLTECWKVRRLRYRTDIATGDSQDVCAFAVREVCDRGGFWRRVDFRREAIDPEITGAPFLIWQAMEGEGKFSLKFVRTVWSQRAGRWGERSLQVLAVVTYW